MLILLGQTFLLTVISRMQWYGILEKQIRRYRLMLYGKKVILDMRMGDLPVFFDIFFHEVYRPAIPAEKPALMVDLGAHIGLASLYFALVYTPECIIAVEPDPQNCLLFQKNTRLFPCKLIEGAINETDNPLYYHSNVFNYKGRTSEQHYSAKKVPGISIRSLLYSSGFSEIGIMKVDMEGAEKILFKQYNDWLPFTKYIIMEVHQNQLTSDFMKLFAQNGYTIEMKPFRKDFLIQAGRAAHS